jgi:predicted nuclease with TOPRIM domain
MIGLRNGKRNTSAGRGSMKNHETSYKTIDRLTNRLEEVEKENKELKEGLFEKFSQYYEVNEYFPDNGFDNPLDFYIHETWKRKPKVAELSKQVEDLKCCGNCKHYKLFYRGADGECLETKKDCLFPCEYHQCWQSDTMTREDRK